MSKTSGTVAEGLVQQIVEPSLAALDRIRLWLLKAFLPVASRVIANRELRVGLAGTTAISLSFLATLIAPLWLLALGPLILGIPHLLADIRYLVIHPGYYRRSPLWLACGVPIIAAGLNAGVAVGLCAVVGAFACARTTSTIRRAGITVTALAVAAAAYWPYASQLLLAHAHNFIAVALWWAWRPRITSWHFIPLLLFTTGCLLILNGHVEIWITSFGALSDGPAQLGMSSYLQSLASESSPVWGLRLVLLFAFAQSVHYAVWLRLVPEDDRARPTPRTFRSSWDALVLDFGALPLALTLLACLMLILWSFCDIEHARNGYFAMALFHGYLELAAGALIFAERHHP